MSKNLDVVVRPHELRERVSQWRRKGERIAFVPTMGNLHAGHGSIVSRASELADHVIVSIFVNPLQFGPNEDFAAYPRTPEDDKNLLRSLQAELLFAPEVQDIYPQGQEATARVHVPGLEDILCGAFRPGHFMGVATVVTKLLNLVQPDVALFGEKDFQQLMIIRRAATDLCMPIVIIGSMTSNMTGVTRFCESFRSVQAAPIAMNSDPNSTTAISRKTANQASCPADAAPA